MKKRVCSAPINKAIEPLCVLLTCFVSAGILYFLYFKFSPLIWGQNNSYRIDNITPWLRPFIFDESQQDGLELYSLYALMFINLFIVYALNFIGYRLHLKAFHLILAAAFVFAFASSVGFYPPMSGFKSFDIINFHGALEYISIILVVLSIIAAIYYLQRCCEALSFIAPAFILIPFCFIFTSPLSLFDASYIFSPALRINAGASFADIYFQYDFFPSLVAWLLIQIDLDLVVFAQLVAAASYYLIFIGIFVFSRRLFFDGRLPIFLLVALVLVRLYAGPHDATSHLQTTPIRLDMWFALLLLVYFKGAHHWSAGLFCGLMLFVHKNFGIIYTAAYLQFLVTLSALEFSNFPGRKIGKLYLLISSFFKENAPALFLIVAGGLLHYLVFMEGQTKGGFDYLKMNIGFMKVSPQSFFWYVPVVIGILFLLLLRIREYLPKNYYSASLLLIYLTIGNLIYFFGRSHEYNIINLSIVLLMVFFLTLDAFGRYLFVISVNNKSLFYWNGVPVLISLLFTISIIFWYGDNISKKITIQANIVSHEVKLQQPYSRESIMSLLAEIRLVSGDSKRLYFATKTPEDFLYYYYGGFEPAGYYNPFFTWTSVDDLNKFLNNLVGNGYFIFVDPDVINLEKFLIDGYQQQKIKNFILVYK